MTERETPRQKWSIEYDSFADCYHTRLANGRELWSDCQQTLEHVLADLDEVKQRHSDTKAIVVSLLLSAALLALAAVLGAIWNA